MYQAPPSTMNYPPSAMNQTHFVRMQEEIAVLKSQIEMASPLLQEKDNKIRSLQAELEQKHLEVIHLNRQIQRMVNEQPRYHNNQNNSQFQQPLMQQRLNGMYNHYPPYGVRMYPNQAPHTNVAIPPVGHNGINQGGVGGADMQSLPPNVRFGQNNMNHNPNFGGNNNNNNMGLYDYRSPVNNGANNPLLRQTNQYLFVDMQQQQQQQQINNNRQQQPLNMQQQSSLNMPPSGPPRQQKFHQGISNTMPSQQTSHNISKEIDLEANFAQHHYAQVKEQQHNTGENNNNSLKDPDLH